MTDGRRAVRLQVERAGFAVIQDLGRPGYADIGIGPNGALDQTAARTANILVGNADRAALIETTGSELAFAPDADVLLAVTGAADHVLVQGHSRPAGETLTVPAGTRVVLPAPRTGLRSYVAVNGAIDCVAALGSVAPDAWLGVGRSLSAGDEVVVRTAYRAPAQDEYAGLFRLAATRPTIQDVTTVDATPGPELARMTLGPGCLGDVFEVLSQSNHVGLRLAGPPIEQTSSAEILSRGVPIGAVEVTPGGGVIILLRGRLVTAGYPVIAVVTTESIDRLGQVGAGDRVRISFCTNESAHAKLRRSEADLHGLTERVHAAFRARGLTAALDPQVSP